MFKNFALVVHMPNAYLLCYGIHVRGYVVFLGIFFPDVLEQDVIFKKILKLGNILLGSRPNFFVGRMTKRQSHIHYFENRRICVWTLGICVPKIPSFGIFVHFYRF